MSFKLLENVNLAKFTTFKIGGVTRYFVKVTAARQLPEIFKWLKEQKIPHFILSGGSNTVFDDGLFNGLVIKIEIKGFEIVEENDSNTILKIGAGENWDEVVKKSVERGLSGIEALSGIPGKIGAAPIQNIGAYGQEIKNVLVNLQAYDTHSDKLIELSNKDCGFGYRDSIFKSSLKGRYIITSIVLKLSKGRNDIPQYPDVIDYFALRAIQEPSLQQVRQAIIEIRKKKFADPSQIPNSGSFFKNPIVETAKLESLLKSYPKIKSYSFEGKHKISAAWLIEQSGLKGAKLNHVQADPNHALVLENTGGASQSDLLDLVKEIQSTVKDKFGIKLEPEPEIVKF